MERFIYRTEEAADYTPYHSYYGYPSASRGVWDEGSAGVALFECKLDNDKWAYDMLIELFP